MPARAFLVAGLWLATAAAAAAQDQQLGARTKAMGGSYTAFEDDPVSVWLNPAGIASQPDAGALIYQTYTTYPRQQEQDGFSVSSTAEAEPSFNDPGLIPSYMGFVFQIGTAESPTAVGVCFAEPYRLNYSFDRIADPFQRQYEPDSDVSQAFSRFRIAVAHDFRLRAAGEPGAFTHVAAGLGLDLGLEQWEFRSESEDESGHDEAVGFGLGVLVGVYDDGQSFRANFGIAYQSAVSWDFNTEPEILPAFDMPQQLNVGVTVYLLAGTPLRVTLDFQWLDWSETAEEPLLPGRESFEDAVNFSIGFEYRAQLSERVHLYPRIGFRRFDAPWGDEDDLPMTSDFQLVLDTDGEAFNIFTLGVGLSWTGENGKLRTIDIGADFGGDAPNVAFGMTYEF